MNDLQHILNEVSAIAHQASDIALGHFGHVAPDRKADRSYVTAADREVEAFVRRELNTRFPEDAIIGEEDDDRTGTSGYTWAIDPVDGTTNFVLGLPHWGICIGRLNDGVPDVGVVQMPALGEQYTGATGCGATMNGRSLHVRPSPTPDNERIMTMWSTFYNELDLDGFNGYVHTHGCTVGQLTYLAQGCYYAAITPRVHVWDIAAGLPVLWEAGGVSCLSDGTRYSQMDLSAEARLQVPPLIHAPEPELEDVRSMITFRS